VVPSEQPKPKDGTTGRKKPKEGASSAGQQHGNESEDAEDDRKSQAIASLSHSDDRRRHQKEQIRPNEGRCSKAEPGSFRPQRGHRQSANHVPPVNPGEGNLDKVCNRNRDRDDNHQHVESGPPPRRRCQTTEQEEEESSADAADPTFEAQPWTFGRNSADGEEDEA
jgi:hypothetical protein